MPIDKQRIARNKKGSLEWKRAYNECVRIEYISRGRAAKIAHTTATFAQSSHLMLFSCPVILIGKTLQLFIACSEMSVLQKLSVPIICRNCNRAFFFFSRAEIEVTSLKPNLKGFCSSCGRFLLSQQVPHVMGCLVFIQVFVCFRYMTP